MGASLVGNFHFWTWRTMQPSTRGFESDELATDARVTEPLGSIAHSIVTPPWAWISLRLGLVAGAHRADVAHDDAPDLLGVQAALPAVATAPALTWASPGPPPPPPPLPPAPPRPGPPLPLPPGPPLP